MKRIIKYAFRYKLLVIVPTIAMLFGVILDLFNPYFSKVMIDSVITKGNLGLLPGILLAIAFITIGRSVLGYIKEYVSDYLSTEVAKQMKEDLYNHIQSLPYSYFDEMNTGELMSRIGEDVDNVWRTTGFGFRLFVENAIYFVLATVILIYLNWMLALLCLSIMIPIAYIAVKLEKKADETYSKISDQTAIMNTTAQENISGVRLVKAFAREKHEVLKFLDLNNTNFKLNVEQANTIGKYYPLIEFLTNLSIILMICIGGIFVINKKITIGTLVAFNGYIWMLITPMRMLGWLTNMLAQTNASAQKIFKIMDTVPKIKDSEAPVHLKNIKGNIKFNNVTFRYKDEPVLQNISFEAPAGSSVAIMGTTGSGKTSIVNLIGRYYDVADGSVEIDGVDVRKLCIKELRSKMSVVSQDVFLFSETVENNVRMGKQDASMEEIRESCSQACADDFIMELQDGYNTLIGERGIGLSGGQKQRISISRALIHNSSILILDDATSALDMETEYALLKNLKERKQKPTTFIIAHRISAVKNADQILFIDNGNVVEKGTHEELLKLKGKYYEIYCEQFKDFEELEGEVV